MFAPAVCTSRAETSAACSPGSRERLESLELVTHLLVSGLRVWGGASRVELTMNGAAATAAKSHPGPETNFAGDLILCQPLFRHE